MNEYRELAASEQQFREQTGPIYSFSKNFQQYGVLEATIVSYLAWAICYSENAKVHDGKKWWRTNLDRLTERYPFASRSRINNALKRLIKAKVLESANLNRGKIDSTLSYSFVDPTAVKAGLERLTHFNVKDAARYGLAAAVVIHNIRYWYQKNSAAHEYALFSENGAIAQGVEVKEEDMQYWHEWNSAEMSKLLPFSKHTLNRALQVLVENKELVRHPCKGYGKGYRYQPVDRDKLIDDRLQYVPSEDRVNGASLSLRDNNCMVARSGSEKSREIWKQYKRTKRKRSQEGRVWASYMGHMEEKYQEAYVGEPALNRNSARVGEESAKTTGFGSSANVDINDANLEMSSANRNISGANLNDYIRSFVPPVTVSF